MDRCPACKARLQEASSCPRCGLDLALPLRVQAYARALDAQALAALAEGDPAKAERCAQQALSLERTALRVRVLAFIRWGSVRALRRPVLAYAEPAPVAIFDVDTD